MALLLTEADVKSILTMPLALEAVEASFHRLAEGSAILQSRQRLHHRIGVPILGLQVFDHLRILLVAQPEVVVGAGITVYGDVFRDLSGNGNWPHALW